MNLFIPFPRATLLIPSGTVSQPDQQHLFVVMNQPVTLSDALQWVALVNITSEKPGHYVDATCRLAPGEHPFIRRASYVAYKYARLTECNKLLHGVYEGKFIPHSPIGEEIFDRIAQGMLYSSHIPSKIQKFYQATLGS